MYKEWWLNLVTKDPIHVFIETTLVLSLIYMVISGRTKDWRDELKKTLTRTEEEELLKDWKENGRTPLAPPLNPDDNNTKGKNNKQQKQEVVVQSMNGRTMEIRLGDEKRNRTVLNLATHDFLGMASNQAIKDTSRDALSKYGCGSCGPRGFYGTIDVHLDLEDAISKFTHTEGAIMYSDGASTCTSTVAAFAKRGDLIVADDGIYEPLLAGITLSRANVIWFRHNDMVCAQQHPRFCFQRQLTHLDRRICGVSLRVFRRKIKSWVVNTAINGDSLSSKDCTRTAAPLFHLMSWWR